MRKMKKYRPIVCNDGFSVSVQASQTNYCEPRNDEGPYTAVELGYPSRVEPKIMPWAEDPSEPTSTVYGWVPADLVLEIINDHGGWKDGELPPMEYATWSGIFPE